MNPRRWGGMLFLLVALVLLGYGVRMRPLPVTRAQGEQVWGGDYYQCVGTRYDCPDPKYSNCSPAPTGSHPNGRQMNTDKSKNGFGNRLGYYLCSSVFICG